MRKTLVNVFITLVALGVIGFLFYVGIMEAKGTPIEFSNVVAEWFK